jgi:hypothetical protein
MTVPQVGHLPLMALRPFFIVSSTALEISFLALHLTQYPSGIRILAAAPLHAAWQWIDLTGRCTGASTLDSPAFSLQKVSQVNHFDMGHARFGQSSPDLHYATRVGGNHRAGTTFQNIFHFAQLQLSRHRWFC